jgi:hypothetical protein
MRFLFHLSNPNLLDGLTASKSVNDSFINVFSFNARSIMNKLSELSAFLSTYDPDCIGITESWLSNDIPNSLIADSCSYSVFRKDRCSRGGGVCVLFKNNKNLAISQINMPSEFTCLEILAIDVCDSVSPPYRITIAYRPPNYDSLENELFFSALNYLAKSCARFCLLGDLNLPDFNWDLFIYPNSVLYNCAADFVCDNGLEQLVDQPTRGDSILDYIFCSDAICCDNVSYLAPLANSDHCIVAFSLALTLPTGDETSEGDRRPNFARANWDELCGYLNSVNWTRVFSNCISASCMWDSFVDIVMVGVSMHVPFHRAAGLERGRVHYPMRIRKLFRNKTRRWRLYKAYSTAILYDKYKRASKACSCAVKEYKISIENKLVENGKLGSFYKYVNKKLNGSNGTAPLRDENSHLHTANDIKAELLNKYFSSVFTTDNGVIDHSKLAKQNSHNLSTVCFTPELVLKHIHHLKTGSSGGPDGLPASFFKCTAGSIAFPLSVIFNLSLQTGDIPDIWKLASVVPVFKKGSPSDPCNYRPISLTCIACKLMESGIKEAFLAFLKEHKIINDSQHGFMARKSTTTHLLECNLDWNIAFSCKNGVDVVYLDFAKAFDSVVHSKLIAKLRSFGICGMLLRWIESFLANRFQAVRVGSSYSSLCNVISGVPQGSVLGPVLFILFVNDIIDCMSDNVSVKLFADDAKIYTVINDFTNSSNQLQHSLDLVASWADQWQLKLSPSKCSVMRLVGNRSASTQGPMYTVGACSLPIVSICTDLGVSYDNHLNFKSHISRIVRKAAGRAKCILKCFVSRDKLLLTRAFCTFVRPLLEFSSVIWCPYYINEIKKIETVQRTFTKSMGNLRLSTYSERLVILNLDSLQCRRLKADLVMCYKILNGLLDIDSSCFFKRQLYASTRGNSIKLAKIHVASERDKNFFTNRVINIWNALPDFIVSSSSVSSFKRNIALTDLSKHLLF